jgi:rfaE bifunctional protein nucleotidyltransferase chain/domain
MNRNGIFGSLSAKESRILTDIEAATKLVGHVKGMGMKVVLTSGSFDMTHIGHLRYLESARVKGDFLIVGVDSDEKVRKRKQNEYRPVVPEDERLEVLCHSRSVDAVVVKQVGWEKFSLIKAIKPDILILVEGTYPDGVPEEISENCGEVLVLPRQAETSTSAKIRKLLIGGMDDYKAKVVERMPELLEACRRETLGETPAEKEEES